MSKFLPVLLVIFVVAVVIYSPLLKINNIKFQDENNCLVKTNIGSDLGIIGKNIIIFDTNHISKKIIEKYNCADHVKVSKKYPNTINIEVQAKTATAIIEGSLLTISEDGYISEGYNSKDLPKIFLPERIKIQSGIKITDLQVLFALNLTAELAKSDFTPTSIRILNPPDIAVYGSRGTIALFTQEKAVDIQVDSLQSVFSKAKIDPTKIAKIDLRFEKPVITTNQ